MTVDLRDLRRSALTHRAADLEAVTGGVSLTELPFLPMVNLRAAALSDLELPAVGRVSGSADGVSVLWLGPDEFLVVGGEGFSAPEAASVVDVSANRTTLVVSGPRARDLLEKAITLDLHPRVFGPGQCAQTTFARAHVLLWQTGEDEYRLLLRSSFADYFADWLIDAALEFTF